MRADYGAEIDRELSQAPKGKLFSKGVNKLRSMSDEDVDQYIQKWVDHNSDLFKDTLTDNDQELVDEFIHVGERNGYSE